MSCVDRPMTSCAHVASGSSLINKLVQQVVPPALASLLLSLLRRPPSSLPIHLYCMQCSAASCCSRASLLNCGQDRVRNNRAVAHLTEHCRLPVTQFPGCPSCPKATSSNCLVAAQHVAPWSLLRPVDTDKLSVSVITVACGEH